MISAVITAPADGGQVIFSVDTSGKLLDAITPSQITVYIAALAPLPAETLRQRQKAHVLTWLREHDVSALAYSAIEHAREVVLATTELGKPYWPNSRWQLNWSHSQHYVALAIAPAGLHRALEQANTAAASIRENIAGMLGIDIELLGRTRARQALINRYFHPSEHTHASHEQGFLLIWTRKEAVLKAHGLGLRIDLKSLNTATKIIAHEHLGRWQSVSLSLQQSSTEPDNIAVISLSWPADTAQ
jgi:4'-phosphopantetheinyl transferase